MRIIKLEKMFSAGFLFILIISLTACEKTFDNVIDSSDLGKWTQFTKSNSGLPGNSVWKITPAGHDLWVAFTGQGLGVMKNGEWTYFTTSNSSLTNNYVNDMQAESDGTMHFATNDGYCSRSSSGEWQSYKDPTVETMIVNTVKVTSKGVIWLGTAGEGFYVGEGNTFEKVRFPGFENINTIEEDGAGNIWLGTDNGLLKYNASGFSRYSTESGLPSDKVTVLYVDKKQRLWIATDGGQLVCWINKSGISLNYLYLRNGTAGNYVTDIFQDMKGDVWFATWFDGLIKYDGIVSHSFEEYNKFYENDVNCVSGDDSGNLWIGLWSKGLVKYKLPLD